ncbi:GntR family transcriptional regulator [Oleispirillum naphthae]|uniref:GntR family transcriptional regulator n=1 Tax=Oleispirillum naphthae TaxID=2838853 RepID=UPI0030822860
MLFQTKSGLVFEQLRSRIMEGIYLPGQKLTICRLAQEAQVSEIPVREALKALEAEGLVENRPHAGFSVAVPKYSEQDGVFQVRQILEGAATAMAAAYLDDEDFWILERMLDDMRETVEANDVPAYAHLDQTFHAFILRKCGNPVLQRIVHQLQSETPQERAVFALNPDKIRESFDAHVRIVASLRARDGELSNRLFKEHKDNARQTWKKVKSKK